MINRTDTETFAQRGTTRNPLTTLSEGYAQKAAQRESKAQRNIPESTDEEILEMSIQFLKDNGYDVNKK